MTDGADAGAADLRIDDLPALSSPLLIMAWEGWNDAGEAASTAVQFLTRQFGSNEPFAEIDGEEFYDFTETRPLARYDDAGERRIEWPKTEFVQLTGAGRDVVVGLGTEPHHRWKRYLRAMTELMEAISPSLVISLGAVASSTPHTRPVPVSGSANREDLQQQHGMFPSRFEGPSGIVGVFHDHCRQRQVGGISLWAQVPHYLPGIRNPKGAQALVQAIEAIERLNVDEAPLERAIANFEEQLEGALRENEQLRAYVEHLEQSAPGPSASSAPPAPSGGAELPAAEDLISDLESFLRKRGAED